MAANQHRVLVLQGGITNGPRWDTSVRDVNVADNDPDIRKMPLTRNINQIIGQFGNLELIIINTHGARNQEYSILFGDQTRDLSLDTSWRPEPLRNLFLALGQINRPITVCLFACWAGLACTQNLVALLPNGSLIGFFTPRDEVGRMEVSQWLINHSISMWRNGEIRAKILWQITPHCQSFIAYKHHEPPHVFQSKELPMDNFNSNVGYQLVTSENTLKTFRRISLTRYIDFLTQNNALPPLLTNIDTLAEVNVQENVTLYKNLWFMQMVIELTSDPGRRQAALTYLHQRATNDLRLHTMQLANIPYRCNLTDYFLSYYYHNNLNSRNDLDLFNALRVSIPSTYHNRFTQHGRNALQIIRQEQAAAQAPIPAVPIPHGQNPNILLPPPHPNLGTQQTNTPAPNLQP